MSIQIREAEYNDAPVIVEFNSLLAKETEGKSLDRQRLLRGVQTILRDPKKGTYYLAEIDGTIVGQLLITYEWSDWRNGNFWWIQSVYVRNEPAHAGSIHIAVPLRRVIGPQTFRCMWTPPLRRPK